MVVCTSLDIQQPTGLVCHGTHLPVMSFRGVGSLIAAYQATNQVTMGACVMPVHPLQTLPEAMMECRGVAFLVAACNVTNSLSNDGEIFNCSSMFINIVA